ncbi:helix-turn-helix domain-containing protein [Acetobacteraceae bacterium KSS8]|uniref:Helix-turn-helix domain-containing protein n=1 Tax=Endosaccharibacter trunci TaxID=2812733 RepID=A0ABT1WAJ6_9PROT|nr:helix-turn-helix domain-containing protein [Acetobacteraceae bacterium KSS8]
MHTSTLALRAEEAVPAEPAALVVDESEAARMLSLAPRTLQAMRLAGSGPRYVQLTVRRIGYPVADLRAWIASRSVASTSEATVARIGR